MKRNCEASEATCHARMHTESAKQAPAACTVVTQGAAVPQRVHQPTTGHQELQTLVLQCMNVCRHLYPA